MSLDVSLYPPNREDTEQQKAVKLLNEHGMTKTADRLSWQDDPDYVGSSFDASITHNLSEMAGEAGIYEALWCPEEIGITHARQLIEPLRKGLALLESDRERFEKFNAENGWGKYENFVPWVREYLRACEHMPDYEIQVSR